MVRTYKRKTERTFISEKNEEHAVQAVVKDNVSIRNAAKTYNLKPTMLFKRVANFRKMNNDLN